MIANKDCLPGLPPAYRRDYLNLLVQGPEDLFAYWEVTASRLAMAVRHLGVPRRRLALAVRILGDSVFPIFALGVDSVGFQYFTGLKQGCWFQAEIGITVPGGFFTLLRSNQAFTPPALSSLPSNRDFPLCLPLDPAPAAYYARS